MTALVFVVVVLATVVVFVSMTNQKSGGKKTSGSGKKSSQASKAEVSDDSKMDAAEEALAKKSEYANMECHYIPKALLTGSEAVFARNVIQMLPPGFILTFKPGLKELLNVDWHFHPPKSFANKIALSRISQKHVDFVIVRTADFTPALAIELDDPSHWKNPKPQTVKSDQFKNEHLVSAGIPFVRIPAVVASDEHDLFQLERIILPYLSQQAQPPRK